MYSCIFTADFPFLKSFMKSSEISINSHLSILTYSIQYAVPCILKLMKVSCSNILDINKRCLSLFIVALVWVFEFDPKEWHNFITNSTECMYPLQVHNIVYIFASAIETKLSAVSSKPRTIMWKRQEQI